MNTFPDRYIFPAFFSQDEEGMWDAEFPDIPNCFTSAASLEEAIEGAKYALEDILYHEEKNTAAMPTPSELQNIKIPKGAICQFVVAHMPPVRRAWSNKSVKKTLSIPSYLAQFVEENDINCSFVLQDALMKTLRNSQKLKAQTA